MFKIEKKQDISASKANIIRIISILAALLASTVVILLLGNNPITIFAKIIEGSFGTNYRFISTINKIIPLTVLSLGLSIAFKMKFWNIGAEGQIYIGAFGAALIAFSFPELPQPLMLILMALTGFTFGAAIAIIPALLKLKWGTSETLVTLMINYIIIKFISYLQIGPWKDPKAFGQALIAKFPENAEMPKLFGVHIGWIIAILLVVFVYVLFRKTKLGYEISVLGENEKTARYAGMNVTKTVVIAVLLSGGICGFVGMMQASAVEHTLNTIMSYGYGFTAIIIAWLAKLSPPAIVVSSVLFSVLLQGGSYIQSSLRIPASLAEIIQGTILFFVLASDFFTSYRIIKVKKYSTDPIEREAE